MKSLKILENKIKMYLNFLAGTRMLKPSALEEAMWLLFRWPVSRPYKKAIVSPL